MSSLKKLIVNSKTTTKEYPGLEGFEVDLAYLTRDEIQAIREKCTTNKVTRRGVEEEVNSELFQDLYIKAIVKGWRGLKLRYLPKLLPVDLSAYSEEELETAELDFAVEEAQSLMKQSTEFDNWVTDVIGKLENFS